MSLLLATLFFLSAALLLVGLRLIYLVTITRPRIRRVTIRAPRVLVVERRITSL